MILHTHSAEILTVGIAGYSGGEMAGSPPVKDCLVVDADSVHRIQEAQAALGFALWEAVQARLSNPHKPLTLTSPSSISQPRE